MYDFTADFELTGIPGPQGPPGPRGPRGPQGPKGDTGELFDGSVTTVKLADGAVTAAKLADSVADLITGNVRTFDTVADMQSATLETGDVCHTLGFHTPNDNGAAWYKINANGIANGIDILSVSNGVAVLVPSNEGYYANQLGMKNDNTTDNTSILTAFLAIHPSAVIYFDTGIYRFSPVVIANNSYTPGFSLIGKNYSFPNVRLNSNSEIDYQTFYSVDSGNVTVFAPIGNQSSLFDLQVMSNVTFKNIMFTSIASDSLYEIANGLIRLHRTVFSKLENLHFMYINGTPVVSYNSYEIKFTDSDFRVCIPNGAPSEHGCIEFVTGDGNVGVNSSAWQISNINFEAVICHWIYVNGARVQNVGLSNIIGESQPVNYGRYTATQTSHSSFPDIPIERSLSVIGFANTTNFAGFVFESVSIDNLGIFYHTDTNSNLTYGFNSIVSTKDNCGFQVVINALQISYPSTNTYIYSGSSETSGYRKKLTCKNISYDISATINIKRMRGTLSFADFSNGPFVITNLSNSYIQDSSLFDYPPYEYRTNARMWKESTRNNYEIARLTPAESTDLNNAAYCFSALGVNNVMVVAKPGSNLTVKRKTNNDETLATKQSASLFDVYTLTNSNASSPAFANIIISGDGTNIDEIFRIIVS